MRRTLLKSKIHRARVTEADLHYEGSITIDEDLLDAANIVEFERVEIYNVTRGTRLSTYAIPGDAGSGAICINGAAAHLVEPDDIVIICSYAEFKESQISAHRATVVHVDETNRIVETAGVQRTSWLTDWL